MCSAALVTAASVRKISTDCVVRGLTSVDDELFVLLLRDDNQVAVYSIEDYEPGLLHYLYVPEYEPDGLSDITSCVRYKCLYMSDTDSCCIYRYVLASRATTKWLVPGKPRGLSVTPSGNLLVTCRCEPNKLVELSAGSGVFLREIALQSDIESPRHSVQLTTGQFVVCNGNSDLHQVCVVGDDGKVTRSYGGYPGCNVGQLNEAWHLAVDKDSQFIFVADYGNSDDVGGGVVLLSPTLEFVRYVIEGLPQPQRLHFHQSARRLFVGQLSDRVVSVIQL